MARPIQIPNKVNVSIILNANEKIALQSLARQEGKLLSPYIRGLICDRLRNATYKKAS